MGFENSDNLKWHIEYLRQKDKEWEEKQAEAERKKRIEQGLPPDPPPHPQEPKHFDHPDTMDNGPATVLYVLVMIVGAIFTDRILIWVFATCVWLKHILRHQK